MTAAESYETGAIPELEQRLIVAFCPPLPIETVQRCLLEALARFDDAPVQTYVPLLVERRCIERLRGEVMRQSPARRRAAPARRG